MAKTYRRQPKPATKRDAWKQESAVKTLRRKNRQIRRSRKQQ